ncbi:helix-turn-helix domain-containing protein [Citricoccus sp. I39-566]|uniref:PucR family transcriptional regulator n=1 Tax=Citricoccus sp. I39-566 TaxID=3073268 RepID=UPI00286B1A44|nr:helix-turn-helix domain-containing protein [Citricoccus sp. I39-566]WMY77132.1 helix-turn-helix domain-containing protein [Citricoccus sp. I39-566]
MNLSPQDNPSPHPLAGGPPAPTVGDTSGAQRSRGPGEAGAQDVPGPPWQSLPPELAELLAPAVPAVVEQIIDAVPNQIPAYQIARTERFSEVLFLGVQGALEQLLSLPGTADPALNEESRQLVSALGAGEFRQGRSMDALLAAYRTSARITFRGLSEACARQGMAMEVVVDLGETILAYIDELSAVSVQAYAVEQSAHAGALELRRADLVAALVGGGVELPEVRRLASGADWHLPQQMAAVVLPLAAAAGVRSRLGTSGIVVERESEATAIVAVSQAERLRSRLQEVFAGTGAVLGPPVAWDGVPHSHRVAQLVAAQLDEPEAGQPAFASDHLALLVLGSEPQVMADLAARRLAPLETLGPAKRRVLEETLLLWLLHWGQRLPVARELGIHAQTVGYRVARLKELFGEGLDDPQVRFELELVLRARRVSEDQASRPE